MSQASETGGRPDSELIAALEEVNYQPLWDRFQKLTPVNPKARDRPFHWPWKDIEPLTFRAADDVAMEDAERRAVIMCNPDFGSEMVSTLNLIGAFTVLRPGDKAPPHRHTAAAIRFATRCEGAVTFVNGRRCEMHEGDLILTPPQCWHGHHNEGDQMTVWFDAANIPLIGQLDASFFEPGDRCGDDFWQVDEGDEKVWESAGLIAAGAKIASSYSPKYRYSREATQRTIAAMRPDPDGSRVVQYINPATGGPVMTTLDCYYMRAAGNRSTRAKRATYNQIMLVVSGEGRSVVGDEVFEWSRHDAFSVPHWTWARHEPRGGDADFFIVTDRSVFANLDLVREELGDPV